MLLKKLKNYQTRAKKKLIRMALKKLFVILAPISIPLLFLIFALFTAALFCAAVYYSMPASGTYTGVNPSEKDKVIYETALKLTDEYNVKDTWLTRKNGSRENLGFLADRYGHDQEIINQWGDIYASALQKAFQHGDENKLENMNWVKSELKKLAADLHPKFYYKESTVTVCGEDGECSTTTVFLLTEADTIRGHYTYQYEWVTETSGDGGSITYEKYVGQQLVGPKWERFEKYLKTYLDVPDKDLSLARQMVFEAGQGFTAKKEWMEWLNGAFGGTAWASGAMVPSELMPFFKEAEKKYGIPWWFLAAVAFTESSFNPQAENSSTGCFGIMQVSPDNWKAYASKLGYDIEKDKGNPKAQIMIGAYLLKEHFGNTVDWDGDWKETTLEGLTYYGGFRTAGKIDKLAMERCRQDYASKIWNLAESFKSAPASWPVPGYTEISSYYGYRTHPVSGKWQFHNGIDIAAPEGASVVSVSAGIAYTSYEPGGYGNLVVVKDGMYEYYYAHLSEYSVVSGQTVRPGNVIGLVGSTGNSTGPHLHFGIKPLDSGQWIDPLGFLRG